MRKNKSTKTPDGDMTCGSVSGTLDVLAAMDVCDYQESQIPKIELLTTAFQGDRFVEDSEKWPKWTMEVNVNPPTPTEDALMKKYLLREESFGGILLDKNREHAYRLNHRAYYILKMIQGGASHKEIFCNVKEKQDFLNELKRLGLINDKK